MLHAYTTTYISTSTTTTVLATSDTFLIHTVVIPKATSGTVTFQDLTGSPVTYFAFPAATVANTYIFDSIFPNGLKVVTSASDVVIVTTATF